MRLKLLSAEHASVRQMPIERPQSQRQHAGQSVSPAHHEIQIQKSKMRKLETTFSQQA